MFEIGDLVMHPTNGICRVSGIRDDDMSVGEKVYILKPHRAAHGDVSILVPCSKADEAGIRNLMSVEEVDNVLKIMEDPGAENSDDTDKDKKTLRVIIRSGKPYKIAEVIRDSEKSNKVVLARDIKSFLDRMKDTLAGEIAYVKNIPKQKAKDLIDSRLGKNIKG